MDLTGVYKNIHTRKVLKPSDNFPFQRSIKELISVQLITKRKKKLLSSRFLKRENKKKKKKDT